MTKSARKPKQISLAVSEIDMLMGKQGISRKLLAEQLGVTSSAVSQIFNGRMALSDDHIRTIAPILKVDFEKLYELNKKFVSTEQENKQKTIKMPFNTQSGNLILVAPPDPTGDLRIDGLNLAQFVSGLEEGGFTPVAE